MPNDTDLTPGVLAELKRLEQAATPCNDVEVIWYRFGDISHPQFETDDGRIAQETEDYALYAYLRTNAKALIAAAEECERLRGLPRKHQWSNRMYACSEDAMIGYCPECCRREPNHTDYCRLAAAIGKK